VQRARSGLTSLDEHPNLAEILGVLAQLAHIEDRDLPRLAAAWDNTVALADARAHALGPDTPLILEVLAAFEAVQSLFAEDLCGEADYVTVDPQITTVALKAVRDAIAGAYARPALRGGDHAALMRAWRVVYPTTALDQPDLGPEGDRVRALLATTALLASRCHDRAAADLFVRLGELAGRGDERIREAARTEAWRAACLTSRRRLWQLVRRSGLHGMRQLCPTCPPDQRVTVDTSEEAQVLGLCLDAACALLVADAIDDNLTDVLVLPLSELIPAPRPSS
jgi:hypothetical protein